MYLGSLGLIKCKSDFQFLPRPMNHRIVSYFYFGKSPRSSQASSNICFCPYNSYAFLISANAIFSAFAASHRIIPLHCAVAGAHLCLRINFWLILNLLHIRLGTVDPTGYCNTSSRLNSNNKGVLALDNRSITSRNLFSIILLANSLTLPFVLYKIYLLVLLGNNHSIQSAMVFSILLNSQGCCSLVSTII